MKHRKVLNSLTRKGFTTQYRNHIWLTLFVDGKRSSVRTCLSHDSREIGAPLQSKMAKQLCLSVDELHDLVDCPMSKDDYVAKLRQADRL